MIGAAVLLGVLFWLTRRHELHRGQLFFIWVAWYGLQRFALDSLRFGNGDATLGPFTWNQVSGLAAGVAGVAVLIWLARRERAPASSGAGLQ
jgi:prolipoprotein diacylglyceryltransferase